MDMKNQSLANLTVAGDAQVHNSVAESPEEVFPYRTIISQLFFFVALVVSFLNLNLWVIC